MLPTIVFTLDQNLLYVLGEPNDPMFIWEKLAEQFQKKSWVNKLILRYNLYSLKLKKGESVQKHIKQKLKSSTSLQSLDGKGESCDTPSHKSNKDVQHTCHCSRNSLMTDHIICGYYALKNKNEVLQRFTKWKALKHLLKSHLAAN